MIHEILKYLMGDGSVAIFIGNYLMGMLGAFFVVVADVKFRNKDSERTPSKFSYKFFFLDSAKRIIVTLIAIFIVIRFSRWMIGEDVNIWIALLGGVLSDGVSIVLKKFNVIGKQISEK
jgi:hypothetical protein